MSKTALLNRDLMNFSTRYVLLFLKLASFERQERVKGVKEELGDCYGILGKANCSKEFCSLPSMNAETSSPKK